MCPFPWHLKHVICVGENAIIQVGVYGGVGWGYGVEPAIETRTILDTPRAGSVGWHVAWTVLVKDPSETVTSAFTLPWIEWVVPRIGDLGVAIQNTVIHQDVNVGSDSDHGEPLANSVRLSYHDDRNHHPPSIGEVHHAMHDSYIASVNDGPPRMVYDDCKHLPPLVGTDGHAKHEIRIALVNGGSPKSSMTVNVVFRPKLSQVIMTSMVSTSR